MLLIDTDILKATDLYSHIHGDWKPIKLEWVGNTVKDVDDLPQLKTYFWRNSTNLDEQLNQLAIDAKTSVLKWEGNKTDDSLKDLYKLMTEVINKASNLTTEYYESIS